MHFGELGLVIEGLEVRRAAGLIKKNHAFCFGRVMQGVDGAARLFSFLLRHAGKEARVKQGAQGDQPEAADPPAEERPAADIENRRLDLSSA